MCVKTRRYHILRIANDLYRHAHPDVVMQEALSEVNQDAPRNNIRDHFEYLANLDPPALIVAKIEDHDMWTARITPAGVDIITGAVSVPGVRSADPIAESLRIKSDTRRGILAHLNDKPTKHVEDVDLVEQFVADSFFAIDLPEIQYQLWYLEGKGLVKTEEIKIGKARNVTAKITPAGTDVDNGETYCVGVSRK